MNPAAVSIATAQGKRDHQEDRAVFERVSLGDPAQGAGWLLAVFDGHGGAATAEKAAAVLPSLIASKLQGQEGHFPEALRDVFGALHQLTRNDFSGSTASLVYVPPDASEAYLGVLGDSPIAVLDSQGHLHIGPDHNVRTNPQELAAAKTRGGIYKEGYLEDPDVPYAGLQMARSLGDAELARVLNREPDVETIPLGGRGIILVGTDGLLDPGNLPLGPQLLRLLTLIQNSADAPALIQDALARQTADNVTAIVWKS